MKKILVTGAGGYLGAKLCSFLSNINFEVCALIKTVPDNSEEWIDSMQEIIIGDVRDEKVIKTISEKKFDIVIHLISLDHNQSNDNPNFVSSVNVLPTWNLLNNLSLNGLKKFIYFSTIHVYGNLLDNIIYEDQRTRPNSIYGLTHLLSENICNYFNYRTETKCINVRLSNSYGSPHFMNNNCWWLVINDFCKNAYENNKIEISSDGSPLRDFIHISDVFRAIEILINTDNFNENTFHISSEKTFSIREIANIVYQVYKKRYNKDLKITYGKMGFNQPLEKYTIKNSKIRSLGFKPIVDLNTGVNELFDYLEGNDQ